jgi:hypothetical protein
LTVPEWLADFPALEIEEPAEKREDGMVQRITANGNFALVILRSEHDLSNNVKRVAPGWRLMRMTPSSLGPELFTP